MVIGEGRLAQDNCPPTHVVLETHVSVTALVDRLACNERDEGKIATT